MSSSSTVESLNKDSYNRKSRWGPYQKRWRTKRTKPEIVAGNAESVYKTNIWDIENQEAKSNFISPSEFKQIKGCEMSKDVWFKLIHIPVEEIGKKSPAKTIDSTTYGKK